MYNLKKRIKQSFAMKQAAAAADGGEPQIRQNENFDGPPTKKNKNKNKKKNNNNNKSSRLCSLPDDVLHIILGLLPVKEAVRTFILSRRWERLWMSMPVLDFKRNFRDQSHFINFVDRVCAFHEPFPIQRFSLHCGVLQDGPLINAWITAVIMRGRVQVLDLGLCEFTKENPPHKVVPLCIFSSETLVELTLRLNDRTLQLPAEAASFFSLPRLKRLILLGVRLPSSETVEKLVSSSPLLETLSLRSCYFEENNNNDVRGRRISLSAPCLRKLQIVQYKTPPTSIRCSSLQKFCYVGKLDNEVCICGPTTRLDAADIMFKGSPTPANVFKLLNAVAHVKKLVLYGESIEGFNSAQFPEFSNLIELSLSVFYSYDRMTLPMLRRCPRLESLTIWGAVGGKPSHELLKLDPVPGCFQTHIKKIRLTNFLATAGDIECVGMLLQMGAVLETMVLEIGGWMRQPPDAQQVVEKVRILPRNSKSCRISVFVRPV